MPNCVQKVRMIKDAVQITVQYLNKRFMDTSLAPSITAVINRIPRSFDRRYDITDMISSEMIKISSNMEWSVSISLKMKNIQAVHIMIVYTIDSSGRLIAFAKSIRQKNSAYDKFDKVVELLFSMIGKTPKCIWFIYYSILL